ncbi:beta-galactosidase [Paenibacillus sp. sptzw28]|uniref:beta-galactosidase n=1 Tax=Paenibacillus sp. sptzw28 TaxID=715179 RepID=UPI001C6E0E5B|nr:beta-galactosidase [Paenibacillus sp. sptzw28]QYR22516.1 beta-galactosidase [Paenibacillus sp. sptzw28]
MTFNLPAAAFRCAPNTYMDMTGANRFRMETTPQGGSISLDAKQYDSSIWTDYGFVTADVYHESHDVLVVLFSFDDEASRSISVHYGILPRVPTRICLPLTALKGEKLFLDRFPGVMQSVIRGDAFVDRSLITRLTISTIPSVASRSLEISGLSLSPSVPQFQYENKPYVDELGQLAGKDWQGKTANPEQLASDLTEEWQLSQINSTFQTDLGRFGGWKRLRFEPTGFFRTKHDGKRWWFVDPDGYALFSAGMDCIHPSDHMRISGMEHLIPPLPDRDGPFRDAWSQQGYSFSVANLIRVFGEEWREKWADLTEHRMKQWGLNTIGNWSAPDYIRQSELPYVYPMDGFPATEKTIFRDFPDVFSPEYERNAEAFSRQLIPMREDPRLIGYFMRNEPHWAFVDGLDLTGQMLKSEVRFASKLQFVEWLIERYDTVDGLNAAWGTLYERFEDLYETGSAEWTDHPGRKEDFTAFNRILIRRYVEVPARACKMADPNHLNLGMRYAWVGSDDVLEGCEAFDVFSVNCYQFAPERSMIEHISKRLDKPVMIGEFHFGAADVGMLAYGIRAVATQDDRGLAYRYFVEQAASIPELIGVHYFQLNDQPVLGRFDGENYQIGVVDVCQQPYRPFVEAMKQAHERMYNIRTGTAEPCANSPVEIPKTGF